MKALLILALCAQPDSLVLAVSGASSLEDLDESQMELYQHLETNPVNINFASRSALLSCGLFTQFQVVSLIEYRSQWGDILSMAVNASVATIISKSTSAIINTKPMLQNILW